MKQSIRDNIGLIFLISGLILLFTDFQRWNTYAFDDPNKWFTGTIGFVPIFSGPILLIPFGLIFLYKKYKKNKRE